MQPRANLLLTGLNKAATTSLRQFLADHPAVCGTDVKEVFFWNRNNHLHQPDWKAYAAHFPGANGEPWLLDNTPRYFHELAAELDTLSRHLGENARAMVVLREPVSRTFSFFKFKKSRFDIPQQMTFAEYVNQCLAAAQEQRLANGKILNGVEESIYQDSLAEWHRVFGARFMVLFFDDVQTKPKVVLQRVCQWLNVDAEFYENYQFFKENASHGFKHRWLHKAGIKVFKQFEPFMVRNKALRHRLTNIYRRLNGKPLTEQLDQETAQKLQRYFEPHNRALAQQLTAMGYTNLPPWLNYPS